MEKRICYPYVHAMVNIVEKWLFEMALNGYALKRRKGWIFYFVKATKKKRRYFMYHNFDASKGLWSDYFIARDAYRSSESKLAKEHIGIFEASENKIDKKYFFYKYMRNNYYKKHYMRLSIMSMFFLSISIVVATVSFQIFYLIVALFWLITTCYAIVSLIILYCTSKESCK